MKSLRWSLLIFVLLVVAIVTFVILSPGGPTRVTRVDHPSPALLSAMDRAKKSLPGFLQELKHPADGQRFAVMVRFPSPEGNEYLWVRDPVLNGKGLEGIVDQKPIAAQVHLGDKVTVEPSDVVDWMIEDPDGRVRGKFTESAGP